MHVAGSGKPPDVAVESRTNVIQLVKNRNQFFCVRLIQKPRQVERENVQHLLTVLHHALHSPATSVSHGGSSTVFESERCQFCLSPPSRNAPSLREGDNDSPHIDVPELTMSRADVLTQLSHRPTEIETG